MDPSPQDRKLTLTIPRRRRSPRFASLLQARLHPSKSAASTRPHGRGAGKTSARNVKRTSALGVAREHYVRKTDWKRRAFTELHGLIRCLFCALHAGEGRQSRGTVNRLPDAAARHLRECCAHFEGSDMFARYRTQKSAGSGRGRGRPSRKQIVAEVVREYEKVAVAEVFCRKDKAHRKRCAELGLSPLDVEERLERHAVLCKAEECECCPHPSFEECLAEMKVKEEEKEEQKKKTTERKKKRQLKQTVPGQLVRIKEEEQDDVVLQNILHISSSAETEETQEHILKRKDIEYDEEEETEIAALLKRRRVTGA